MPNTYIVVTNRRFPLTPHPCVFPIEMIQGITPLFQKDADPPVLLDHYFVVGVFPTIPGYEVVIDETDYRRLLSSLGAKEL